jgi:hypothetical protein
MDPLAWVYEQEVVLQSARGPVPNLAEQIVGEPIRGSWWGHPSGHEIFAVLNRVRASGDVVATRLIEGRVTLVHRPIWPALVRVADRFPAERLAALDEQHTDSGGPPDRRGPVPGVGPSGGRCRSDTSQRRRSARAASRLSALTPRGVALARRPRANVRRRRRRPGEGGEGRPAAAFSLASCRSPQGSPLHRLGDHHQAHEQRCRCPLVPVGQA